MFCYCTLLECLPYVWVLAGSAGALLVVFCVRLKLVLGLVGRLVVYRLVLLGLVCFTVVLRACLVDLLINVLGFELLAGATVLGVMFGF